MTMGEALQKWGQRAVAELPEMVGSWGVFEAGLLVLCSAFLVLLAAALYLATRR